MYYKHPDTQAIVNIIEMEDPVATTAIFRFHTMFVMNYVTWNRLVSMYPKMMVKHVGLVNTQY